MSPEPDLSWLPLDEEVARRFPELPGDRSQFATVRLKGQQISTFWKASRLEDAAGSMYEVFPRQWSATPATATLEGDLYCYCPTPPSEAGPLTLHLPGADYPMNLLRGINGGDDSEFGGGCPGPRSPSPFHGGAIRVVAVLAYRERVVIEWLMQPAADLSWVELNEEQTARIHSEPKIAEAVATHHKIQNLWLGAELTDNQRAYYLSSPGRSNRFPGGAYRGEVTFRPALTKGATELNLVLDDLSLFIPLC
jgi:hypothetical protein